MDVVLHSVQHQNANDAIEALQVKLGFDGDTNPVSHDFRMSAAEASLGAISTIIGTLQDLAYLDTITMSLISDASTIGKTILAAANAAAVRTAIGLGTLATQSTVTASQISDASSAGRAMLTASDATAQGVLLGLNALAFVATIPASTISDSTSVGRSLLTAANIAAQKTVLAIVSTDIGDSTSVGRNVLTAANAAAARAAIGVDASGTGNNITASQITDATSVGLALITAANAAAGRSTLGLGTLATQNSITSSTDINDATTVGKALIVAANAAAGRTALGLGTLATQNSITSSTDINDATTVGKALIVAANAAAGRTALGLGTISTQNSVASTDISDSTSIGRSILTAADAAAERTLLGLGTLATLNSITISNITDLGETIGDSRYIIRNTTYRAAGTIDNHGDSATATGSATNIAPTSSLPILQNLASTTTTNAIAGVQGNSGVMSFAKSLRFIAWGMIQELTVVRFFVGWTNSQLSNWVGTDTPHSVGSAQFCGFRFSSVAGDTNFMYCVSSGSATTVGSTGVTGDTGFHAFEIRVNAAATSVDFYIDNVLVKSAQTANLPAAGTTGLVFIMSQNTVSTVKNLRWSRMYSSQKFL